MGKGGCVDGHMDTTMYSAPIPLIGIYIAVATLVCFFSMSFDLVYGLFIRKHPFIPCRLFSLNSLTITVLAVATKIPVDLITSMPRAEDQLSKLTGTALLCTSLGFFMPSLGKMGISERYGNLAALSVVVITMVINICVQMRTGVIFAFPIEHIIIIICILVLLLLMWSSVIGFRGQIECIRPFIGRLMSNATDDAKGQQGLRKLLVNLYIINYSCNPQAWTCENSHHHTFGLLCNLSSVVVLQAMGRSFTLKKGSFCSGVSDYKWSILVVIVAQLLTIVVGTICIIRRWLSIVRHSKMKENLWLYIHDYHPERELEYLKLKSLSFRIVNKNLRKVFLVAKDFIIDVLIHTQIVFYKCSSIIGIPIFNAMNVFLRIFHQHIEGSEEMPTLVTEIGGNQALSSLWNVSAYNSWIMKMAIKDEIRWTNTYKRDHPTHLIQLMSKWGHASKSECALFRRKLEGAGEHYLERVSLNRPNLSYQYRVSCVSVMVLSGILAELMPSPRRESLMNSLEESFEIIYYVDQKIIDTPSMDDETRWTSVKFLRAQWDNPNHNWFRSKFLSLKFQGCSSFKNLEESVLEQQIACWVLLRDALDTIEKEYHPDAKWFANDIKEGGSLAKMHEGLIVTEFLIICKFIREQEYESDKDLFDFLEKCFIKMLYCSLSGLPLAILKEIKGEYPSEIGEERVRKALKFLCKLELLEETRIEWSWPPEFDPESDASHAAATDEDDDVTMMIMSLFE